MKKLILILTLLASVSASAVDFNTCDSSIQNEIQQTNIAISNLEDAKENISSEMIDILSFSVVGFVAAAPNCDTLRGMFNHYRKAFNDLK